MNLMQQFIAAPVMRKGLRLSAHRRRVCSRVGVHVLMVHTNKKHMAKHNNGQVVGQNGGLFLHNGRS